MKSPKYLLASLLALLTPGCVVASIPIGYAGAIAAHESGHVAAAYAIGQERTTVDFVPRFRDGNFRFAETEVEHKHWSKSEETWFKVSGPLASLFVHVSLREALKAGLVPVTQVPVAWIALGSEISLLYHIGLGLGRVKGSDLGEQDIWISAALLGGVLVYDIWDFVQDSDMKFRVLMNEKKYKPKFGLVLTPQVFGFKLEF